MFQGTLDFETRQLVFQKEIVQTMALTISTELYTGLTPLASHPAVSDGGILTQLNLPSPFLPALSQQNLAQKPGTDLARHQIMYQPFARNLNEMDREGEAYFGIGGSRIHLLSENEPPREAAKLQCPDFNRERCSAAGRSLRFGFHLRMIPFLPQQLCAGKWRLDMIPAWPLHHLRQHGVTLEDLVDRALRDLDPLLDEKAFRAKWGTRLGNKVRNWAYLYGGLSDKVRDVSNLGKHPRGILNGWTTGRRERNPLGPEHYLFDVTWCLDLESGTMFPSWNETHRFNLPPPLHKPRQSLLHNEAILKATKLDLTKLDNIWLMGAYPHLPAPSGREAWYLPGSAAATISTVTEEKGRLEENAAPGPARSASRLSPLAPSFVPQVQALEFDNESQSIFRSYRYNNCRVPHQQLDQHDRQRNQITPVQSWRHDINPYFGQIHSSTWRNLGQSVANQQLFDTNPSQYVGSPSSSVQAGILPTRYQQHPNAFGSQYQHSYSHQPDHRLERSVFRARSDLDEDALIALEDTHYAIYGRAPQLHQRRRDP